MRGTPGRARSALTGALEGFAGGGGLIGAITGAAGGAISPRRLRERQFNQQVRPELMEQFAFEDADIAAERHAQQNALNNEYRRAQIGELESQAYKNRLPPPAPRPRQPIRSDRGLYDPEAGGIITGTEPLPPPPKEPTPIVRVNERGEYEDVGKAMAQGRKVKAFQKPKATGTAKPKKEQKFVPLSKIREYAKMKGISRSEAEAQARADGYTVVR